MDEMKRQLADQIAELVASCDERLDQIKALVTAEPTTRTLFDRYYLEDSYATVASNDLLGLDWIKDVATTPDSDLRAHRIALTYHKFATALDDMLFGNESVRESWQCSQTPRRVNANWFHFAMWGTLTVSQNIGTDRPPQRLNTGLASSLRRALTPTVAQARAADGQVLGRALAWGQLLIFVSACTAMRQFMASNGGAVKLVENDELAPGSKLIRDLSTWDGAQNIRVHRHVAVIEEAFQWLSEAYKAGRTDRDRAKPVPRPTDPLTTASKEFNNDRARLILGATVLLTAVEQDLVDPALGIVVDLVPKRVAASLERRAAKWAARWQDLPIQLSELALSSRYAAQRKLVDSVWSRLMTDQVLVMALPTETLRLGRDLPPRRRGHPFYPAELEQFGELEPADRSNTRNVALADVAKLIASIDRTVGDGQGSAARDWRRWDERMNWAVTLFRSRQQDLTLFWPPYSQADQERIVRGELPRRTADPSALDVLAPIDGSVFLQGSQDGAAG